MFASLIAFRAGERQRKAKHSSCLYPGVSHVVAVTQPDDLWRMQIAFVLNHRHQVAKDLAGMMQVGMGIDHRHV
jgi:hypothetical protein